MGTMVRRARPRWRLPVRFRIDARMMAIAAGVWVGALSGLSQSMVGIAVIVLVVSIMGMAARRISSRRLLVVASAICVAVVGFTSWMWASSCATSPPAQAIQKGEYLHIEAVIVSDAQQWRSGGGRPARTVMPVRLTKVTTASLQWSGSQPARVSWSGDQGVIWAPESGAARDPGAPDPGTADSVTADSGAAGSGGTDSGAADSGGAPGHEPSIEPGSDVGSDAGPPPDLAPGATITFEATSSPPQRWQHSVGTLRPTTDIQIVREPGFGYRWANHFRHAIREAMSWSTPTQAGLVPSLVVGDTSRLDEGLAESFRLTGLAHITAVSGSNLALMVIFAVSAAKACGMKGRALQGLTVLVTAIFVVVCRGEPSVIRAAAMGLVALSAAGVSPDPHRGLRHLGTAIVAVVLIDPWLATSWAFALSVAACAGIVWWGGMWSQAMNRWAPPWLTACLVIPLAAQMATTPLIAALAGRFSIVGVFANMVAGPFVGPVTVLGLIAGLAGCLHPTAGSIVGYVAGWCAEPLILIARVCADAPLTSVEVAADPLLIAGLVLICLAIAVVVMPVVMRTPISTALLVAVIAFICCFRPTGGWPGEWQAAWCDVGQGGAHVVTLGSGRALVVDSGPDPRLMRRCLRDLGIQQIALFVLTHAHADHRGGLAAIFEQPVEQVLVSSSYDRDLVAAHAPPGTPIQVTHPGQTLDLPGEMPLHWVTLSAGGDQGWVLPGEEDSAANDNGVVGYVWTGQLGILFTGDIEDATQTALIPVVSGLQIDVLCVPHHGSKRHVARFFQATRARIAVIQVGRENDYGHPAASTLADLGAMHAMIVRTDLSGDVLITADGTLVRTRRGIPREEQ